MKGRKYQTGATAAGNRGGSVLYIIIGLLILALAGGAYYYSNNIAGVGLNGEDAPTISERTNRIRNSDPPVYIKVDAMTIKLLGDGPGARDAYVQIQPDLRAIDAKTGERIKQYMPAIRMRILLLVASKRLADLSSAEGIQKLANEIRVEANAIVDGPMPKSAVPNVPQEASPYDSVQSVVFSTFITQ